MPSSTVYSVVQDKKGYIWFATEMGVSRYDGYEFRNFTTSEGLSDNDILNIFEDSQERLWFLAFNGKPSYYYNDTIYNEENEPSLFSANSESYITSMAEDTISRTIWMSTYQHGIVSYSREKKVRRYFNDNSFHHIGSIIPAEDGDLVLFEMNGIHKLKFGNDSNKTVSIENIVSRRQLLDSAAGGVKSLQLDNGEIIFSSYYTIWSLDKKSGTIRNIWRNYPQHVNNICKEGDRVWICLKEGAVLYQVPGRSLSEPIFEEYSVTSVLKDSEGNLWVTTLGDGVFFCPSNSIYQYTTREGLLTNRTTCLSKDDQDKVWIGYEKSGISCVENGKIKSMMFSDNATYDNNRVNNISFSYDKCWVVTNFGLILIDNDGRFFFPTHGRDMVEFPENNLIVASSYGILNFKRSFFEKLKRTMGDMDYSVGRIRIPEIYDHFITRQRARRLFVDSKSNIWIATENDLSIYHEDSLQSVVSECLEKSTYVNDFAEMFDDLILLATNKEGVVVVKERKKLMCIGKINGLSSDYCNALDIDNDGTLWVATNNGLNKIEGFPDNIRISLFNANEGILSNEVRDVLVVKDTVWIATHEGVNFFRKDMAISERPPLMYLNRMTANRREVMPHTDGVVVLKHSENDIAIYFTGISYRNSREIIYRYKLQDEGSWSYTKNNMVEFPRLSPGDYRFVVASSGRHGGWSEEASIGFVIEEPYWQTNIFLITVSGMLLGAVWLITSAYFGYRRNQIIQKYQFVAAELKALKAQINPHFFFNALNSIHAVLLKKDMEAAQEYLHKFGNLMRNILDHSDETMITISEEVESLKNYLAIEQLRMDHKFDFSIDVQPGIDIFNMEVPAMIVQPFVENAIVHGIRHKIEKGHVGISFSTGEGDALLISITDDGIGRKRSMELNEKSNHKSKGMKLITDRLDMLNVQRKKKIQLYMEDLTTDLSNGPGTCVTIKIPME